MIKNYSSISINIKTNPIKVSSIQGRKDKLKRNVEKLQIQRKNHCAGNENRDFISDNRMYR